MTMRTDPRDPVIAAVTERLTEIVRAAHLGKPIEIDGITYDRRIPGALDGQWQRGYNAGWHDAKGEPRATA